MLLSFIKIVTVLSVFFVIYHHLIYPMILRLVKAKEDIKEKTNVRGYKPNEFDKNLPSITMVIPAYNEQAVIEAKINNIAILDYPREKLKCIIACDGCSDRTVQIAKNIIEELREDLPVVELIDNTSNIGKVGVLNTLIPNIESELVVFTDTSALVSTDALLICASRFEDRNVGVVTGTYRLLEAHSEGENKYWDYQCSIKRVESYLGSTIGAHGAFYMARTSLIETLPADTINDDFIIPMRIVGKGYKALYESRINSLELEKTEQKQEEGRRRRIGAGNFQQAIRLRSLLSLKHKWTAFNFLSGKVLRTVMPLFMIFSFVGSLILISNWFFALLFLGQSTIYLYCAHRYYFKAKSSHKLLDWLYYLVQGHIYSMLGAVDYLKEASRKNMFISVKKMKKNNLLSSINLTKTLKRAFDIFGGSCILLVSAPLFPLIALAIKLDSKGSVLFRQTRIGLVTETSTKYFEMIKFRTMVADAEKSTGAVLAQKADPRITKVGMFLRKSRLDELPQLINVLKGDMSLVGPRPERPDFYPKLEDAIPYFTERTYGVKPGITGLAQVNQGYDTCVEDVRRKVGFDHSYALTLTSPIAWLKSDVSILFKTLMVMIQGRGQ